MKRTVFLRAFRDEDAIEINRWRNTPEVMSLTCGRFRYVGLDMEKAWVHSKIMNNSTEEYFAICLADESEKIIGYQCLRNIDNHNRSAHAAGIVIAPEYQDGIYMIDAFLLLLDYSFTDIGLNRLTGSCLSSHIDSMTMMEMLGFSLEGIERESLYKKHQYMDICKYAILYREYIELLGNDGYSLKEIARRAAKIRKHLKTV